MTEQLAAPTAHHVLPMVPTAPRPVPAVDRATMLAADQVVTDRLNIGLSQLMENAGRELATLTSLALGGEPVGARVVVLAGTGNNAGGGLVAARRLAGWGARVLVAFALPVLRLRPAPCAQLDGLMAAGVELAVAGHDRPYPEVAEAVHRADVVIDALIGYGLRGAPRGPVQALVGVAGAGHGPVISLDVPTGIDATSGERLGAAVRADATLALALPKRGLTIADGPEHAGALYLADIGVPASVFRELGVDPGAPFERGPLVRLA